MNIIQLFVFMVIILYIFKAFFISIHLIFIGVCVYFSYKMPASYTFLSLFLAKWKRNPTVNSWFIKSSEKHKLNIFITLIFHSYLTTFTSVRAQNFKVGIFGERRPEKLKGMPEVICYLVNGVRPELWESHSTLIEMIWGGHSPSVAKTPGGAGWPLNNTFSSTGNHPTSNCWAPPKLNTLSL